MAEVSLYEGNGAPTVYLAVEDEMTFYAWDGRPLGYLADNGIYGFNGVHLGWFEDGIIWDHQGRRCGYTREALPVFAQFEPFKAFKQFKPFRAFQQFAPFKPFKTIVASGVPLLAWMEQGRA